MIADIQYMEKGKVYRVRNRKTGLYLTSGSEIMMSPFNRGKITQLWLFDEIKPMAYEIVSLQSGLVLTRSENLSIEKGVWGANQFWKLVRAQIKGKDNYFWITQQEDELKFLSASSVSNKVGIKSFDRTLFVSNWLIQEVNLDDDLSGCCLFRSAFSKMAIDVPEASNKDGVAIIQYAVNGRGNQRWVLERVVSSFVIRNLCTCMSLCPQGYSVKLGTKIIQTQFSNRIEQKWVIRKSVGNCYLLQNEANPKLFIGVPSNKESACLQLLEDQERSLWLLEGSIPQIDGQN